MSRPDISGNVIDKGADGAEGTGGDNGFKNEEVGQDLDTFNGPEDGADENGGRELGEVGEETGQVEGTDSGQEPGTEPGQDDPAASQKAELDRLKHDLRAEIMEELKNNRPAEPPKEISEEEWVQHEASWGIPRTAIKNVTQRMVNVVNHVMAEMDKRFAKFEKSDQLKALSQEKGFTDAARYQKDVDEFLSHYDVKHHSNPDLLKRAVIYARGKNMKTTVDRAAQGTERNRRIAGVARPNSGSAPAGKNGVVRRPLTAIERSAARVAGWSDEEYLKNKAAKKVLS